MTKNRVFTLFAALVIGLVVLGATAHATAGTSHEPERLPDLLAVPVAAQRAELALPAAVPYNLKSATHLRGAKLASTGVRDCGMHAEHH